MGEKIVIIGGGAGGMTTAAQLIKMLPNDEIILFDKGPYVSWAGCPTPYFIGGELSFKSVVHYSPEFFREKGIKVYENHNVVDIDFENKKLVVQGEIISGDFAYDKLILSLGGKPFIPNFEGYRDDLEGIFRLSHASHAEGIKNYITEKKPKKALVIGGGFIGLEMAEAFERNNLETTIVELQERLFPRLPKGIADDILKKAEEKKIDIILGKGVKEILSENGIVKGAILDDGTKVEADIILVSIGIKPNIDLLKQTTFPLGEGDRVEVDEYLRTKVKDVYALGDMIFNVNKLTGKLVYAPYGDVADKQAIVLAKHLSGKELKWKGVSGSFATSFYDLKIAATGLNLEEALEANYNAKTTQVRAMPKVSGFGERGVKIDVVYDDDKKTILGAFGIGKEAVAQFVDQFSIAITMQINLDDLFNVDFPYSPTNASVWNPLTAAYRRIMK